MNRIAKASRREREDIFIATSREIGLPEAMVEKDFWVCWCLNYLFHDSPWADRLAFKGGTSLSKCFGLIDRFSEDIDVVLDWRLLGYETSHLWEERSRTQQDKMNKETVIKTNEFLNEIFVPKLQSDFSDILSDAFSLHIDDDDPQTVCFTYPRIYSDNAIISVVRMEMGVLAAWTPVQNERITSYAAEVHPQIFETPSTQVLTVSPKRTFWEKITILHKEAFRADNKFPSRYSRHYYDLYCMDKSVVKEQAYADLELLDHVVKFKAKFYPASSAHYELATPGSMRLMPPDSCIDSIRNDYTHMRNMIFGEQPMFDDVIRCIQKMEHEIKGLPVVIS